MNAVGPFFWLFQSVSSMLCSVRIRLRVCVGAKTHPRSGLSRNQAVSC